MGQIAMLFNIAANVSGICEGGYVGTSNYAVTVQPLLQIPC
nr:hypothetical protein [uncultured Flavobacterium sp.]